MATAADYHARRKAVCDGYSDQLAASLSELRKQDTLCDVTIHIGGQSLRAHRAVLAASSSYFMGMFTRGFAETHQNEITIEGNAMIFECLLEFAYTGELPITDITAYDIITMANYMQFILARDTALKYVRRSMRISPEDAFKITLLDFLDRKLINRLQFYLVSEMNDLGTSQVFLQEASFQYMMELMERKDLTEVNETEIMRTLISWLQYDWENRKTHVTTLFKKILLDKVSGDVLQEKVTDDVLDELNNDKEVSKKVRYRMRDTSSPVSDMMSTGNTITAPIKIGDTFEFSYFNINDGVTHEEEARGWHHIPLWTPFPGCNTYARGTYFVVINGTLYAKTRDQSSENVLYRYSSEENHWDKLCQINSFENIHLVYMEPCLYSIDGRGDIQSYSIIKNRWEILQPIPTPYFYDVIISTFMGKILVYGEVFDLEDDTSSVYKLQVYEPEYDKWTEVLCERFPPGFNSHVRVFPLIFTHNGACYRVMFKRSFSPNYDPNMDGAGLPIVHELKFNTDADRSLISVEVGDEECQDLIRPNLCGAFRIADDVFVSWGSGFVFKTRLKAWEDKWDGDVDLAIWDDFRESAGSNVVMFTFDKELLGY